MSADTNYRSTSDIIWSCIATVFACTWVSVHPNLLSYDTKPAQRFKHRLSLLLWAFAAPEFLVIYAYRQWAGSCDISEGVQRIVKEEKIELDTWTQTLNWGPTHSHFLQMGGFMFQDPSRKHEPPEFVDVSRLITNNKNDIGRNALKNVLMNLPSEDEIWDKSKGDVFTKLITALQTCWFLVQLISRSIQNLAICELEIITLAYATFNIAMFFFWRTKPLDVQCPIVIPFESAAALRTTRHFPVDNDTTTELVFHLSQSASGVVPLTPLTSIFQTGRSRQGASVGTALPVDHQLVQPQPSVPEYRMLQTILTKIIHFIHKPLDIMHHVYIVTGFRRHRGRYPLTAFSQAHDGPKSYFASPEDDPEGRFQSTVPMFYAYSQSSGYAPGSIMISALAMFLASCFGALHCVAWSFRRVTISETLLWRMSALIISLSPVVSCITFLVAAWFAYLLETPYRPRLYLTVKWILLNVLAPFHNHIFIPLLLPCYLLARLVLLVLAFAQLRRLPVSGYQDVDWSAFIPHF